MDPFRFLQPEVVDGILPKTVITRRPHYIQGVGFYPENHFEGPIRRAVPQYFDGFDWAFPVRFEMEQGQI